jgi:integrase
MAGHVETKKLKSGKRYYPVIVINGKREYWPSYKTRKNAEAHLRRLLTEVADGTYEGPKKKATTFGEWATIWLKGKESSVKPSTWASYEQTYRTHILPFFEDQPIRRISPRDVQSWVTKMTDKGLAPATVARCYRYLRACLKQAEAWGDIEKCPCRKIDLPRQEHKELEFLQPDEFKRLLEEFKEPERTFIAVLAYTGLRLGEAQGLAWKHVNFEENIISIERAWNSYAGFQDPKTTTSRRAIPMMPNVAEKLRNHYEAEGCPPPDALVFTHGGERPIDSGNTRKKLYGALEEAGLKHITLHSLRHSYSSLLLASGASIKALQRSLGHATASMTLNTYSHLIPEDLGNALLRADNAVTNTADNVVNLPLPDQSDVEATGSD